MKHLNIILLVTLTVALFSCKKKSPCGEGVWPEGYTYYDVTGSEETEHCVTPLIRYWITNNPTGPQPKHEIELTCEQGLADIHVRRYTEEAFQSGETFDSSNGDVTSNTADIQLSMNLGYDANGSQYVNIPKTARFELTAINDTKHTFSGVLEYSFQDNSPNGGGAIKEFRAEFDNASYAAVLR